MALHVVQIQEFHDARLSRRDHQAFKVLKHLRAIITDNDLLYSALISEDFPVDACKIYLASLDELYQTKGAAV